MKYQLKKILIDILILLGIGIILLTVDFNHVGLQLFLYKILLVSGSIVHAHISRHLLFPYIKFNTEKDPMKKLMVIALYVSIIWAYAQGG